MTEARPKQKRVHGRKVARPLTKMRQTLLNEYLPQIKIADDLLTENANLNPSTLFPNSCTVFELEIGFGDGERLAHDIIENANIGYLGAEPYLSGVAQFLKLLQQHCHPEQREGYQKPQGDSSAQALQNDSTMGNIKIIDDDAMLLVHSLRDQCLDKIYILNPDPWPKKRHHKRRIVSQENLDHFARTLKTGGELIMTTDVDDLAEWMATQTSIHGGFEWSARHKKDWQNAPEGWRPTKYEQKGANHSDKRQSYLIFTKKSLQNT